MWFRHEEGRREGHPPRHRKIVENEKKKREEEFKRKTNDTVSVVGYMNPKFE